MADKEKYTMWDRIGIAAAVSIVLVLLFANKKDTNTNSVAPAAAQETYATKNVYWRLDRAEKRLNALEQRVFFPLFSEHCRACPQCRGDEPTEDGPPALCEEGFKLWQNDLRNQKNQ
ncbi:hypothetical protein EBZ39_00500 [bacterium]|nr:hypothetical protein [bacterium]